MKKMTIKNQKILKITHIVVMSLWFSSVVTLLAIMLTLPSITNAEVLHYAFKILEIVDFMILSPAAAVTLITGLIYIIFTKWKWKQTWLLLKLIISVVIILAGTFWLGPTLKNMTLQVEDLGMEVVNNATFIRDNQISLWASIINTILLLFTIAISTLKPNKNKKK